MAAAFFEAASPFGALADWEPQTGGGETVTKERASSLGSDGDETHHKDHGEKKEVSATYNSKATEASGNYTVPSVGAVLNGYVVESIKVTYGQEFPTLEITGHKHTTVATGAHANMRTYSPTIDLPKVVIGVPAALGPVSCDGARSLTYSLGCTHIDEMGGIDTLVGAENHDGVETIEAESVCAITVDTNDEDYAEWTEESKGADKANNAATANKLTLTRHVKHDVQT